MGVLTVAERSDGTRSSSINKLYQRDYVRTFVVETSAAKVGAKAVRTAGGIPQVGNSYTNGLASGDPDYEEDRGSFVQSIEAVMDQGTGGVQWTVTVTYGPYDSNLFGGDPTQWKMKVSFGGERTERVVYYDKDGHPIGNSAGDPFDPPIVIDDNRVTMTVVRNELVSGFDLLLAEQFNDTINTGAWNGFAARTVKLGIITTSEPQYDSNNQVYYYTVTYPFTINRATWRKRVLDAGCNEVAMVGTTLKTRPIMTQGQQVSDPVPLDGAGHRLPLDHDPVFLDIDAYDEADYSDLNMDLSLRLGA